MFSVNFLNQGYVTFPKLISMQKFISDFKLWKSCRYIAN